MNILLVSASIEDAHRSEGIMLDSHYPLGMGYLHSSLQAQGHKVVTMFLNDYPYINCALMVANAIARFSPDAIGFNMLTMNRVVTFSLIGFIHATYRIKILLGGVHATVMADQLFKEFPYVTIVKGEGETTFNECLYKPAGIYEGKMCEDLDSLPMLAHYAFWNEYRTTASILTSRGCPFQCSFCVLKNMNQRKIRYRSPENVVDEMVYLAKNYPSINRFWIHDDAFTMDNDRAIKICEQIIKRMRGYAFIASARVKPISKELVDIMEKAGFLNVLFGMESGSPKILESCHKGITQDDVVNCHKLFVGKRCQATYFLIAGLPGENDDTVAETVSFVKKLQSIRPIHYEDIGVLMPYPGTEVYDNMVKAGKITDDYWLTDKPVPFYTVDHTKEELFRLKDKILEGIR